MSLALRADEFGHAAPRASRSPQNPPEFRKRGQSAAVHTSVTHARAEWVGTLDGDRQSDPRSVNHVCRAAFSGSFRQIRSHRRADSPNSHTHDRGRRTRDRDHHTRNLLSEGRNARPAQNRNRNPAAPSSEQQASRAPQHTFRAAAATTIARSRRRIFQWRQIQTPSSFVPPSSLDTRTETPYRGTVAPGTP